MGIWCHKVRVGFSLLPKNKCVNSFLHFFIFFSVFCVKCLEYCCFVFFLFVFLSVCLFLSYLEIQKLLRMNAQSI